VSKKNWKSTLENETTKHFQNNRDLYEFFLMICYKSFIIIIDLLGSTINKTSIGPIGLTGQSFAGSTTSILDLTKSSVFNFSHKNL